MGLRVQNLGTALIDGGEGGEKRKSSQRREAMEV
jgi:hypothetical protein